MEEPLAHPLSLVSKRYLAELSKSLSNLLIDRHHNVLVLIEKHQEKLSQKELAEFLHIDKSYMVTILNYLEERGYVTRNKNLSDRREQVIKLTPLAKKDIPIIKDAIEKVNNQSLKNVSQSKKEIFNEVLNSIQGNLDDLGAKDTSPILKAFN